MNCVFVGPPMCYPSNFSANIICILNIEFVTYMDHINECFLRTACSPFLVAATGLDISSLVQTTPLSNPIGYLPIYLLSICCRQLFHVGLWQSSRAAFTSLQSVFVFLLSSAFNIPLAHLLTLSLLVGPLSLIVRLSI